MKHADFLVKSHKKESDMTPEKPENLCMNMPLIGDKAPSFVARTTNGIIKFPEQYIGRWIILFSHPMDFTPVCTTEFMSFQAEMDDFQRLNTELVGLSVGAITSHLAWFRSIHEEINFNGLRNIIIKFPVIEDIDLHISKLYGMIHPNTSETKTVRAVFIIDDKGIIRTVLYYPQTTGRNIKEIKRILIALQTSDIFGVSTPANWMPGDKIIKPIPKTSAEMNKKLQKQNKDVQTWYFTLGVLPESKIFNKIKKK